MYEHTMVHTCSLYQQTTTTERLCCMYMYMQPKIQPGISIRGRNSRLIKNCLFSKSSSISLFSVHGVHLIRRH